MKPFKVAFIGAGDISRAHAKYLKAMSAEGVEIIAAADVSERSINRFKEVTGPEIRTFSDYKAMLREMPEIDAVDICTPNGLHAETTLAALNAGKHVMVEKPMAMNAREGQAMLAAAEKSGRQLIVGFQYRFDPRTKVIHDQIAAGAFGKIMYVRAQALRRRGIPNWGVFGRKDLQGGGPMIDIGVHILECAHYMVGSPKPMTCSASTWTYLGNQPSNVVSVWPNWDHQTYTVEDLATGIFRFDNGMMLTIESSFVAHIKEDVFNVTIFGEKGGAVWESSELFTDHGGYMMNMTPGFLPKINIFEYKLKHFVEVCRDGRPNESPGEHGLMVQKMLDGVYASSAQGREVGIE